MKPVPLQLLVGETDIYLLDQIMKNRFAESDVILDAGCGMGRNLHWFLYNNIRIVGVDSSAAFINELKLTHPQLPADSFHCAAIENMPFPDNCFDHIICSAVLHFANSLPHFNCMVAALTGVLKPGGTLFIRMASNIGIEHKVQLIGDGVYHIPDSSIRFLLTKSLLATTLQLNNLTLIEPLKTVNVDDVRCMSTLVLAKG